MAERVKNLPPTQETQETWVRALSQEIPLQMEMATTPGFLHKKPYGQRSLASYSLKVGRVRHSWATKHKHTMGIKLHKIQTRQADYTLHIKKYIPGQFS